MDRRVPAVDDFHGSGDDVGFLKYAVQEYNLHTGNLIGQCDFKGIYGVSVCGECTGKGVKLIFAVFDLKADGLAMVGIAAVCVDYFDTCSAEISLLLRTEFLGLRVQREGALA